jgi:hypothetical protein
MMWWWQKVIVWRKKYQKTHGGQSQDPPVQMPRP